MTVTDTLRLTGAGARAILALFLVVHAFLAVMTLGQVHSPLPVVVALALLTVAGIVLVSPAPEPLPAGRTAVVIGSIAVISALVAWNLAATGFPGYASWNYGANTILLVVLALRGRTVAAWAGWLLMLAITIAWALSVGRSIADPLSWLSTHAGTLVVGSLFAHGLRRTSRRIGELHAEQAGLASTEAAGIASAAERIAHSAYLEQVARPALERIAAPEPYTASEKTHWLDLESAIRDSLRSPALMLPEIVDAATAARGRGVTVVLLDDSTDQPHSRASTDAVVAAIVTELTLARGGQVTARVLPAGRPLIATIVVESGEDVRVLEVAPPPKGSGAKQR